MTEITAQSIDAALRKQLDALNTSVESRETGSVIQVGDGIARVDGLKNAMAGELLEFTSSTGQVVYGMAQNLEEDEVGAVLLGDVAAIKENDAVKTTGRLVEVPSGKAPPSANRRTRWACRLTARARSRPRAPARSSSRLRALSTVSPFTSRCRPVSWPSTL